MFSRSQTGSASQPADENGPRVFEGDRVTSDRGDTQEKPSGTESRSSRKEWKGTRREELGGRIKYAWSREDVAFPRRIERRAINPAGSPARSAGNV